ncbi:MerR family transcriptional regulator, partial [Nonomuraea indica]|uniref:MerR family transcriptional regulator n=1 Tax=Nonomuraea indica TaxID=1581193 RepID=UPI001C5F4A88
MNETWTIGELAEHAAGLLRDGQRGNGRVREVPGERLIRWYTTIGLVDPPLSRRGRIARYGRRHLLQLVAVKRLQAAGRSIADIQAALAGATDAMLEAFAETPDGPGGGGSGRDGSGRETSGGGASRGGASGRHDSGRDAGSRETAGCGDGDAARERARFWARAPLDRLADADRTASDRPVQDRAAVDGPVQDGAAGERVARDRATGATATAGGGPAPRG